MKEAVVEYERIAGAKVNFHKSEGLLLGAWRGSNTFPGPFRWSGGPIRILGVWFGPDVLLERNWSIVHAKVNAQVGIWLSRRLSLKGRAEGCAAYVFPLIFYRLAVLPLPKAHRLALQRSLSRLLWGVQGRWSVGRSVSNVHATGVWVCLIWRATGLLKDLHIWAESWRGTQCRDERRVGLFLASTQTQRLMVDEGLWAKHCLSASAERPFVTFLGPVTFHGLRRNCIGNWWWVPLLILSASSMAERRRRSALTGIELLEQLRFLAHLATCSECVIPSRLELQGGPGRHAWLPSLRQWLGRNGWARLLVLRASPPVLGSRRGVDGSHRTQTARAARRWLRRRQRSSSVSWWEAYGVSRDPSCSPNGDLDDAKQGIVWRCKLFSSWSGFVFSASAEGQNQRR